MSISDRRWNRFAYVAVKDATCREAVGHMLIEDGWRVETRSTGFHVVQDLCDVIAGEQARVGPGLIVIDADARGCSGITLALGLRDLGVCIPVVIVASTAGAATVTNETFVVVEPTRAADVVARLIRVPRPSNDLNL